MTTLDQDIQAAFNKFKSLDNQCHQLDILCESITEREKVQLELMEAIKSGDAESIGKIILKATADYAHDCTGYGGTL